MESGSGLNRNESAVLERRKIREANAKKRAEKLEVAKNKGNEAFKAGDYKEAVKLYASAIEEFGPKAALCSNLAATFSKLELWKDVEWVASLALKANPQMSKARFRRAMARKAQKHYTTALLDLDAICENDPACKEALTERQIVRRLRAQAIDNDELDSDEDDDDDECHLLPGNRSWPTYSDDPEFQYESDSDTEDCRHKGNSVACRFYNHGGCSRGNECSFSHAPDDKSVRDELGKNVCLHYLLGDCKFGDTNCIYSHDKRYLPPPEWWDQPEHVFKGRICLPMMDPETYKFPHPADLDVLIYSSPVCRVIGKHSHQYSLKNRLKEAVNHADRVKDVPKVTPNSKSSTADSSTPFILLISLEKEEWFSQSYGHLLSALSARRKVVEALNARDAIHKLSWPGLDGVIVTDAGVASKRNAPVKLKLVEYVKSGGTAVIGCMFSNYIAGNDFVTFFNAFGLPWQRGSYHRTTFYTNPINHVVRANSSLAKSYSMKALHADNIAPDMAIYQPTDQSITQSMVFPLQRVNNFNEAPIVIADSGKGLVGYIGDVNAEKESTNAYLAMLHLLDDFLPQSATTSATTSATAGSTSTVANTPKVGYSMFKAAGPSAAKAPSSASTSTPKTTPAVDASSAPSVSISPAQDGSLLIALLDGLNNSFTETFSKQLALLLSKTKVDIVSTSSDLEERLVTAPNSFRGVYIADAGLLKPEHQPTLTKLASFVQSGGLVVAAGIFPSKLNEVNSKTFFSAFGLTWTRGTYGRAVYELISTSELAKKNPSMPEMFSMKSLNLKNIPLEAAVYIMYPDDDEDESVGEEPFDAPVLRERVGRGAVGYIGSVSVEEETDSILLAMFGLLDPQTTTSSSAPPARTSKKFVLMLSFGNEEFVERAYGSALKKLEEKIEVVRGLSVERMTDLVDSPDLSAVFISSSLIASPKYAYLLMRLVEYSTRRGGVVVFLEGFARDVTVPECRPFFLDAWGLDWTTFAGHYPVEHVRFNEKNVLVAGRTGASKSLPENPDLFSAHTMASSKSDDVVYAPKKLPSGQWGVMGGRYAGPLLYASVGEKGRVGYIGHVTAEAEYVQLLLAMIGL